MSGSRRNNSCSNQQQFEPYMLGRSKGYAYSRTPQVASINTMSASASSKQYQPPNKTCSLYDTNTTVRDCLYWPASLNYKRNAPQDTQVNMYSNSGNNQMTSSGDFQYCSAPPKVYISGPDGKGQRQQNIPCHVAPLGTDPASMIKPMQPLTVRVQAPPDLFAGDPSQPKTISISPAQLYGGR